MTTTAISADTHTSADLQTALNNANAQVRATDEKIADAQAAHRSALHQALVEGSEVPKPPAALASLADHRVLLVGARDYLQGERDKAKAMEQAEAQRILQERKSKIHREWERRAHLSYGLVLASIQKYNEIVGRLPDMGLIARNIPHNNEKSERHAAGYAMPQEFTNPDLHLLAENHIEQLF